MSQPMKPAFRSHWYSIGILRPRNDSVSLLPRTIASGDRLTDRMTRDPIHPVTWTRSRFIGKVTLDFMSRKISAAGFLNLNRDQKRLADGCVDRAGRSRR